MGQSEMGASTFKYDDDDVSSLFTWRWMGGCMCFVLHGTDQCKLRGQSPLGWILWNIV